MIVDWSAASPFVKKLEQLINKTLARLGGKSSVSLGDIWHALATRYPEGSSIDFKCPEFKRFLNRRLKDQLRSDRRQTLTKRYRILSNFDGVEPVARHHEPSDELIRDEEAARVWTLFNRLPESDRDLLLARFEKRSPKIAEMARDQELSRRTIKRRQQLAWNRLLRMLNLNESIGGDS